MQGREEPRSPRQPAYGSDGDDQGLRNLSEPERRRAVISNTAGKNCNRFSNILDIWDGRRDSSEMSEPKRKALLR